MLQSSDKLRGNLLAIGVGLAGAGAGVALNLPAAALIGSSLAVSAAAWAGRRPAIDERLRDPAFALIGISLGAGIGPGIWGEMLSWVPSLVLPAVSVVVTLVLAAWMLRRFYGQDRGTSILASSPGTLSFAVAMAVEGRGDVTRVMIIQSLRLLILVSALPLALRVFGGLPAPVPGGAGAMMGPVGLLVTFCGAMALGWLGARLGMPASYLIGGMVLSGVMHGSGLTSGPPPRWLLFAAFTVTGSAIGSRFSGVALSDLLRLSLASLSVVGVAALVSAVFAVAASLITGLPAGQTWVAFAPGGVEAMAAIGLVLGFDPAYIALHHLTRLMVLVVALPIVMGREVPEED